MSEATTVPDREVAEFLHAVSGPPGALDAWLKVNGEAELRAHIQAVITGAERTIIALQTGCAQWQMSAKHARQELDEAQHEIAEAQRIIDALNAGQSVAHETICKLEKNLNEALALLREVDQTNFNRALASSLMKFLGGR